MFDVKVIADSVSKESGKRLVTLQMLYPRFIHSEFLTHRMFSRNSSSSRAIDVERMLKDVSDNPAIPVSFAREKSGMQGGEEITGEDRTLSELIWKEAAKSACSYAEVLMKIGVHKQVTNRLLEPFQHMRTILTATEFDNFFKLRIDDAADPNIRTLAELMRDAIGGSEPVVRSGREPEDSINWHLPYVTDSEREETRDNPLFLCALSSARCARVSYNNHDGTAPSPEKDTRLHNRLLTNGHLSPHEHQGVPIVDGSRVNNLIGWIPYRAFVETGMIKPDEYVKVSSVMDEFIVHHTVGKTVVS